MRNNNHVTPARTQGTPSQGNSKPLVNMPANNNGTFPVKLGAGKSSQFGSGVNGKAGNAAANQPKGSKVNMPTNNDSDTKYKLGTTKHGVGEVPDYLKNRT